MPRSLPHISRLARLHLSSSRCSLLIFAQKISAQTADILYYAYFYIGLMQEVMQHLNKVLYIQRLRNMSIHTAL